MPPTSFEAGADFTPSTVDEDPSPQPLSPVAGDDGTSISAITVYERLESLGPAEEFIPTELPGTLLPGPTAMGYELPITIACLNRDFDLETSGILTLTTVGDELTILLVLHFRKLHCSLLAKLELL